MGKIRDQYERGEQATGKEVDRKTGAVKDCLETLYKGLEEGKKGGASTQEILIGLLQGVSFLLLDMYEKIEKQEGGKLIESKEFKQAVRERVLKLVKEGDIGSPEASLVLTFALMRSFHLIGEMVKEDVKVGSIVRGNHGVSGSA